jgi:hypothetical protein
MQQLRQELKAADSNMRDMTIHQGGFQTDEAALWMDDQRRKFQFIDQVSVDSLGRGEVCIESFVTRNRRPPPSRPKPSTKIRSIH